MSSGNIFWDKYIEFEHSQEAYDRVAALYSRILATPLQSLPSYYERFKHFASMRPAMELANEDEKQRFATEGITDDAQIRERVMTARDLLFYATMEEVNKRKPFESNVCHYILSLFCHQCVSYDNCL